MRRPLLIFFAITFAYAWSFGACMIFFHLPIEYSIAASCAPTIGALIARRITEGDYRAFRVNVSWPRTLLGSATGVALVILLFVAIPAMTIVDARKLHWRGLISLSVYNYSTLLGGPLFEEPGWRGFALPRLETRFGPAPAALLLGSIWAAWHIPFFWYPGWATVPMGQYFLMVVALAVIMALAANLARFGVIAPVVVHAVNNTVGRYLNGIFENTEPGSGGFLKWLSDTMAAHGMGRNITLSFTSLIVISACTGAGLLMVATRGRLGYSKKAAFEAMAGAG
jgi:membrane protease YdiL (CAAX protease family)